jgi:putative membrane-bound dehydrogenase-like protein
MKVYLTCLFACAWFSFVALSHGLAWGQFTDKSADRESLPKVPQEFEVTLFASEPLVRQPCSMAFDEQGRLFVGMGPQYRNPKPDSPGDSVVIVEDTNGDGVADKVKVFATGFNCIQGLAWHGRDLWIANAPDLTVVRDLDGDDEADEYIKVYTDLGNLEHGLHGLNWAPDGKLYMSKGNSKGLNQPGRHAPKPFRDLWGVTAPADVPDFPTPVKFSKDNYRRAYHDPDDDWGLDGGVLRCDDGGKNLEIVARGMRNPWDIAMDSGFNWLGTDNDQVGGDQVIMPFYGAHFGWNHPWSSHWGTDPHPPTAPVSGPLFGGSGTGIIYCESPQFPPAYRHVFFINDWLRKTTFKWTPKWDGALMTPEGGTWEPFIQGGKSLFRPTDLEVGPDGALWILGWSSGYGAEWKNGQLTNEGRIFRVSWKEAKPSEWNTARRAQPLAKWTVAELIEDFQGPLPVWRINAANELVRRGDRVKADLIAALQSKKLTTMQETWTAWTLGRLAPQDATIADYFTNLLSEQSTASFNLRIQAIRILAYRVREQGVAKALPKNVVETLNHANPRLRFAAVQAVIQARQQDLVSALLNVLAKETDRVIYYTAWQGLRELQNSADLQKLLEDQRGGVRKGVLLALLESNALKQDRLETLAKDSDAGTREIASLRLNHATGVSGGKRPQPTRPSPANKPPRIDSPTGAALVRNLNARSGAPYKVVPGGFAVKTPVYVDRGFRLSSVPPELEGADLIQTANNDKSSRGDQWLSAESLVPVRVWVGIDTRHAAPNWVRNNFVKEPFTAATDEGAKFVFYQRTFDAGPIQLGGNTDDGRESGMGNYIVAISPLPLEKQQANATVEASLALLDRGDRERGELLFRHPKGAGCAKCHSLDQTVNGFGPNLSSIGLRANVRHIVESIVEPSAVITEGFKQVNVITDEGNVYSGVLLEESGLSLSLGQSNGERVDIPKDSIEERRSSPVSAMPDTSDHLTPQQVADLTTFLMSLQTPLVADGANPPAAASNSEPSSSGFGVDQQDDRLRISLDGKGIVEFVFRDDKILRPYFANARLADGRQVTRNHPPVKGEDALDHDTMHPGIWLGFGDISGHDFWRNKAAMEHVRFVSEPQIADGRLTFSNECRLKTGSGQVLGSLTNAFTLMRRPSGWLLVWDATFHADQGPLVFGDQEEMGFGARVATPFTEKNGGVIRSSSGKQTAKETWGQPAKWCDYSGTGPKSGGIQLMSREKNFRESWWHNRDYGILVANPFGREAMKQGPKSSVEIRKGQALQLRFGALIHDDQQIDLAGEYKVFLESH